MSLIETALQKAKELSHTAVRKGPGGPLDAAEPVSRRDKAREPLGPMEVAVETAQARVLPVASVDRETMERHGVISEVSDTAALRAYRILRTRVQQRMRTEGWRSLGITAAGSGEGKTLTAINLAISLARDVDTWVTLVDFDMQRPMIASYLGMEFGRGLSDYLAGTAELEDIVYSPGIERLGIVPNAEPIDHSSDVIGSHRIHELCQALVADTPRHIVIFDTPPVLLSDDVLKMSPNLDSVLLVVSEGQTRRMLLQRLKEATQQMNVLGVVLNRTTEREESRYY